MLERRVPFRPQHLEFAKPYVDSKKLILGGAFDPPAAALLVFDVPDKSEVEAFAKRDPYVKNGLVPSYNIKPWTVVIGSLVSSLNK